MDSYQTSLQTNWRQTKLSFAHQFYIVVPLKIDKHLKILWMGGLQRQQKFKDVRELKQIYNCYIKRRLSWHCILECNVFLNY